MTALIGLLPCAVVVIAVLAFRLSTLTAAGLALTTAISIWAGNVLIDSEWAQLERALVDALILQLLVGVVIYGGLMFVEVTRRGGTTSALYELIGGAGLNQTRSIILIAIGFGVMIESLTGYGVSMLVTVPLLLRVVTRAQAIVLALVGMSLMPWGALSVSALLGAQLAGIPASELADQLLTTSAPVAFLLPLLCAAVTRANTTADWLFAVVAGITLVIGIALTSKLIGVEVAGVGGGAAVIALCLLTTHGGLGVMKAAMSARAIWAYPLLILCIVVQKLVLDTQEPWTHAAVLATERVSFDVLASPALALAFASALVMVLAPSVETPYRDRLFWQVSARAWRALAAVGLFLLTARVLVEVGAVNALAALLSQLGGVIAGIAVALLGGLGAYVTGSGVTANALFMPSAAETGASLGQLSLFAALQHSGAGHTAMASLPVIALLTAALPTREPSDEQFAVKVGLALSSLWMALVISSGLVQMNL